MDTILDCKWVTPQIVYNLGCIPCGVNFCTSPGCNPYYTSGRYVRPWSVSENVHNLNHMVYFDQILHTNACQHYLTTGMCNSLFDGRGFPAHHFSRLSVGESAHN